MSPHVLHIKDMRVSMVEWITISGPKNYLTRPDFSNREQGFNRSTVEHTLSCGTAKG